ncbi:mechanosensitive ion channel family protein [Dyella sp.]|uniref:mechanosensitive ion channel family protein n=1 Tax=Dyella sp. TaxID=1869338 RepID=UPI002B4A597B|nr:mechanosensitive ion channel domain-containing protein [Dyella sp.]HKT26690.1 mechanosensitive ion channel domain-containing protein [Dyella sp.]
MAIALPLHAAEPASASINANTPCIQSGTNGTHAANQNQARKSSPAPAPKAAPASAAAKPAAKSIVPLQADGLIARSLRQISLWADGFTHQLDDARRSLAALFVMFVRSGGHIANEADRDLLLQTAGTLAGVFAAAVLFEWLLHFLLRRPLRALVAKSNAVEQRDRTHEAHEQVAARREARSAQVSEAAKTEQAKTVAGVQPPATDVALVHTQEHGVDKVEPVQVGEQNSASSPSAADAATAKPRKPPAHAKPARYVNTLHHLLFAAVALLINLVPLGVFFVVAGLVLRGVGGDDERVHDVVSSFIDAYISARITMAVLRLLVSPEGPGMCVLRVSHQTTKTVLLWMRCIVFTAAFGMALGDALAGLGGGEASRMAFIKLVSLFVHIAAVILILKLRGPVGRAIAAAPNATGPIAATRNWLSHAWVLFAVAFVLGVWVVWALGVEDGFPKLIHFIGVSAGILIVARVITILVQGALGRAFRYRDGSSAAASDARSRLSRRYYPIVSRLVSFFITVFTIIALLQSWGLDALGWLGHGAVGRSLTSAVLTILVATVIAIAAWEAASFSIERRITVWTDQGDLMRAARLRTLLPMMRTGLLILVVLVVGLTALNEIGINTTPLLASASIVGVALGFGSQKLVQDFITGIFLLMENAMQVGDWVTVAGVSGTVEYLSVRTVRLRGGDGSLYTIPFSSVTTVNNTNRGIGNASMAVSIAYGNDIDSAMEALTRIGRELRSDPAFRDLILKDLEIWGVDAMDGSKVTIVGQMQCLDKGRWGVQRELNRRITQRFREAGIEMANPHTSYLLHPQDTKPSPAPPPSEPTAQES